MLRRLTDRLFRPAPSRRVLDAERSGEFFGWFGFAPAAAAEADAGGAWHCFRPSGPAFAAVAELDVRTDAAGAIVSSLLGLDRSFIDGRNGPFARDLARSYLGWALAGSARDAAAALIANVGDLRAAGAPVLVRGDPPPAPAPDKSGLADVFSGRTSEATARFADVTVEMLNFGWPFPSPPIYRAVPPIPLPQAAWLRIGVSERPA
jgi:hypothetical protein